MIIAFIQLHDNHPDMFRHIQITYARYDASLLSNINVIDVQILYYEK